MATQEDPPYPDAPIPPVYKDYVDDMYDYQLRNRVVAGPGISIGDAGGGGKQISALSIVGLNALATKPFQVIIKNFGTAAAPAWKRIVSGNSTLYDGIGTTPPATPTTLNVDGIAADDPPKDSDPAWTPTSTTDVVWLHGEEDSSVVPFVTSGCAIQSLGNSDTFTYAVINDGGTGSPTTFNQTAFNLIIAVMGSGDNGEPIVDQQSTEGCQRIEQLTPLPSKPEGGGAITTVFAAFPYGI